MPVVCVLVGILMFGASFAGGHTERENKDNYGQQRSAEQHQINEQRREQQQAGKPGKKKPETGRDTPTQEDARRAPKPDADDDVAKSKADKDDDERDEAGEKSGGKAGRKLPGDKD